MKARPSNPEPRRFAWRPLVPFAALAAVILIAYADSFQSGLVFDNSQIIGRDPRIQSLSFENLRLIFTTEYWYPEKGLGLYRPFATLTYLVNDAVLGNGAHPAGYHVVNYLIHSVNAGLVFLLALALFADAIPAFAAAAIWAVHPVLTESVTNIIGRADLLAAFGVLAALLCFIRSRQSTGSRRAMWWVASGLAAAVGVFSKESGIVVLGLVPLFDLAFPRRQAMRRRLAAYAAVAIACAVYLAARHAVLGGAPSMRIPFSDNPIAAAPFWTGRLTALGVLARDFALLAWPARLSADYAYNAIPLAKGFDVAAAAGVLLLAACAAIAIWGWRRDRKTFFFVLLGLGALLPTSNLLFPVGTIMAERFLYLPALGFVACLVAALWSVRARVSPAALRAGFAVIALIFVARTFARNLDWRSQESLFRAAEEVVPNSHRVHQGVAKADLAGNIDGAVREIDWMLRILAPLPDELQPPTPYLTAGETYSARGDSAPAAEQAEWYAKAVAVLQHGRRIAAAVNAKNMRDDLAQGRIFQPTDWDTALDQDLGYTAMRAGEFDESIAAIGRSLQRQLRSDLFIALATAYLGKKDARDAEITLLEGTIWRRNDTALTSRLIATFRGAEPNSCALAAQGDSYRLNSACPLVQREICEASARLVPLLEAQGQNADAARVRMAAGHVACGQENQ